MFFFKFLPRGPPEKKKKKKKNKEKKQEEKRKGKEEEEEGGRGREEESSWTGNSWSGRNVSQFREHKTRAVDISSAGCKSLLGSSQLSLTPPPCSPTPCLLLPRAAAAAFRAKKRGNVKRMVASSLCSMV